MDIVRCEDTKIVNRFRWLLHYHHRRHFGIQHFGNPVPPYEKKCEYEEAWVAKVNGHDVGFTLIKNEKKGELLIDVLYVLPKCRKMGIGRALIDRAFQSAKEWGGIDKVILRMYAGNTTARPLYEGLGFVTRSVEMYKCVT